jgi:hypothetical protein
MKTVHGRHCKQTSYPGSGPSWGGKTPTPACLIGISVYSGATMVLLELFVSRKKKNRASYWQPCAWLDGLQGLSSPQVRVPLLLY